MSQIQEVKITNCDPGPLGVFGLSVITLVASSQKLGLTSGTSMLIPWAIFLGAGCQLIASIQEYKRSNIFASTAFGMFSMFWLAVGMVWLIQNGVFGEAMANSIDPKQVAFGYTGYLVFSIFVTVAAMEINKCLFIILVLIDLLLIGLAMHGFGIAPSFGSGLAAWSELIISILGLYTCGANFLNVFFNREVLPLGKPLGIIKKGSGPAAGH